jgi:hypothetical protein
MPVEDEGERERVQQKASAKAGLGSSEISRRDINNGGGALRACLPPAARVIGTGYHPEY